MPITLIDDQGTVREFSSGKSDEFMARIRAGDTIPDGKRKESMAVLRAESGPPAGPKLKTLSPDIIPEDSIFHDWLALLSIAETPISFQLLVGLASIGASLRRTVYVHQGNWNVYPNLSVLLVGPSGIGKDTAINEAIKFLETTGLPKVYGRTIEVMLDQLVALGDPAACYIPAPEITSFLGQKDYQGGMMNELTDLLSTKSSHDVSTKTNSKKSGGAPTIISRPTICMFAGSTEEWLHKSMPEGSLEGGWWPRFLIACEEYGVKFVPLLGYLPKGERERVNAARDRFYAGGNEIINRFINVGPEGRQIDILSDARDFYINWYRNRHKYFSKTVRPYAERSRDQVLRLALIMAISRGHSYIDLVDMRFADELMMYVAKRIDHAVQPPSAVAKIAKAILPLLPASHRDIMIALSRQHDPQFIEKGEKLLLERGEIVMDRGTGRYEKA